METGSYNGRRIDFTKYAASRFNPFLFSSTIASLQGCGATALALLTGVDPALIAKMNQGPNYSDAFMLKFLRLRAFRVQALTQCNLTQATGAITSTHVLLASQLFTENEATWSVIYGGVLFHNFELLTASTLCFLNKPLLTAYLIHHPSWNLDPAPHIRRRVETTGRGMPSGRRVRR